jgi:uncharacterized protein (DUF885 family)
MSLHRLVFAIALAVPSTPALAADAAARLQDLFAREWQARLKEEPQLATSVGVHDYDHLLAAEGPADYDRRAAAAAAYLAELGTIDRGSLSPLDRDSAAIFERQLRDQVESHRFGGHLIPLNADSGFHSEFARLAESMPLRTVRDYENYVARLRAFPRLVDDNVALMKEGLRRGMTPAQVALRGVENTVAPHLVSDPEKSVLWKPFARFPVGVPVAEHARLRAAGREAIAGGAVAGYRRLHEFLTREYLPGLRKTLGASEMPDGRAYYDYLVRSFTTREDLDAEKVHQIGLGEVKRIRTEMDEVIKGLGFQGDFAAFLEFLRTDPRFYPKTPEELLRQASFIAKRMDAKLPSLFRTLPRQPYGVEPVPDSIAPKYTAGRYVGAPLGGTQAGTYWVNTYALETRPLYNLEALTLHEAVPGHHLQGALAKELEGIPPFRRYSYLSAFGEGWGLYSERLGLEAGFYQDPYSNFGRLTYEMWRACRLVVDTGLHAKGWTRQQAMDYLAGNTALSLHEVETETDRYISWPGQALSYKIGELTIRSLRKKAEEALGPRFDVRAFHDAVLLNGSVPLPVLEQAVDRYIAQAAGS